MKQILYNATVYTLNKNCPTAEALVIEDNHIVALGSSSEILQNYSSSPFGSHVPKLIDLRQQTVIPGLVDAHVHLEGYGQALDKVDCETTTLEMCLDRVSQRAAQVPEGSWITGHGWNQNNWQNGYGKASDLDRVAPNHPVYLTAKSLHAAWMNTLGLQQAGINSRTPDPEGGYIQKDQSNLPTGILFETAMQLGTASIPKPGILETAAAIEEAQSILWRMGLTGIHDFDGQACFSALQILKKNGVMKLRVLKNILVDDLHSLAASGIQSGFGDDLLRIGGIKIFADGALGPQTAATLKPYNNKPENHGMLMIDGEQLFEVGREAVEHNLSLTVHAIGDRANHEVLNGFSRLREYEKSTRIGMNKISLRHRIEHVQLIHPEDCARLAEMDIIASMQPIHATSDMDMAESYWGERSANAYAWRSLLKTGTRLAFGSDAPVESPNPFWGMHAAVTRRRLDGSPGIDGWYPEQRISRLEAIKGYTTGPAYVAGTENHTGKLAPGFLADLLILDKDYFRCSDNEIPDIHPLATMINGEWVYQEIF